MLVAVPGVYIGWISISPAVAEKIQTKHGITPDEVREACSGHTVAKWEVHPEHGRRLLVIGTTGGGRTLKVVLQPIDPRDGTWRLRTALVATRRLGT